MDAVALVDAEEVLENTQNSLEELWRLDYPQARMAHLLEVIANQISRYVQVKAQRKRKRKKKLDHVLKTVEHCYLRGRLYPRIQR